MATILFAAAGAALGSGFGGTVLGLSGAVLGRAVGATVGRALDQRLLGAGSDAVEIGRIDRFHVMGASEGAPIAKLWGRMRISGQVIWASPFRETRQTSGGKGMPSPKTVQYAYSVSLAIALCEGEILGIGRIWADGDEISPASLTLRVYHGTESQLPDPLLEAHIGDFAPAYRGTAYVVVDTLDLGAFGNRVPQFSFEVMRRAQGPEARKLPDYQDAIRAVALIPGTGEYALAAQKVWFEGDLGVSRALNVNAPSGESDLITSLTHLTRELPNCRAVSLVVSWFGNDLRCGDCEIRPKVEQKTQDPAQMPWRVGGISRNEAEEVPRRGGSSIYGGTPSDQSVIEAIQALKAKGQSVMFYPFILMDQMEGNTLPDPYSDAQFQPSLPWRGRITLSRATGRRDSPDLTADAAGEVASFFGTAQTHDFSIESGRIAYNGPAEWRYRRFILHYAHLCKRAGGVESFCIGSEMRGLTQIRGENHTFPAVSALVQLAADVREILGPDVKISYAADWSEYFGLRNGGDVFFHLDPLWSDSNIDFIGIDNYMPISDWRDGEHHADAAWGAGSRIAYLDHNISGGEGYDWFYDGPEAVELQHRSPIKDMAFEEDWVFRYKDIRSWWSLPHHNRVAGVRSEQATAWVPQSKPIRFTEYGAPAIDKGNNEPNKFLDAQSSESALPRASSGMRDDFGQFQYFRAHHLHWSDLQNNPISGLYDGTMVDVEKCYAWAWDARPFPEFPKTVSLWSDGPNYARGHWLNGRVTSVPADRLVAEVCEGSGLTGVDSENLYGLCHGYTVGDNLSARAVLQPLSLTLGFDSREMDGKIQFQSRLDWNVTDIQKTDLVSKSDAQSDFEIVRGSSGDSVARLRFSYIRDDGMFSSAVVEARDADTASLSLVETEYPMLFPTEIAKSIVDRWMVETRNARDQITLGLPLSVGLQALGSVVRLEGVCYRVDHMEINQHAVIRAVRVEPLAVSQTSTDGDVSTWTPHIEASPLFRLWLDLPLVASEQIPHAPFLAVTADPWTEPAVLFSSNADYGYTFNSKLDRPAFVGKTLSDLPRAAAGLIDRGPDLMFELPLGEMESVSLSGMLSGLNLVAIGDGSAENWEIFQFMKADLVSSQRYSISIRLRGLAGTDAIMPDIWPAGSYIVPLSDKLRQISLLEEHLNTERHFRLIGAGQFLGGEAQRYDVISFRGIGLRPLSVSHFNVQITEEGLHHFRWIRRTRFGGDAWEGYDVPLSEEREIYLFVVLSLTGAVVRREVVDRASFFYTAEMRIEDDMTGAYHAEVSQISMRFGEGPRRRVSVFH